MVYLRAALGSRRDAAYYLGAGRSHNHSMVCMADRNHSPSGRDPDLANLFRLLSGERTKGRLVVIALYGGPHPYPRRCCHSGGSVGMKSIDVRNIIIAIMSKSTRAPGVVIPIFHRVSSKTASTNNKIRFAYPKMSPENSSR